ncbi:PREDICTED: peroxisomal acyl-coenzyme A oxidase 2 isoform X2 [Crocodylus porosus]|uniref:peroxisomal acyl-coenzyme A oxidase 2 isoform X2 n=1 Tax=Crocodylus porosus TaxID=8502 RepID=UPI00093903AE|nr:PREDICTED: peroxisomal acyl-coenzyme A oxidase 2 isoform X2 [Crocodylus porosus]
MAPTRYLRSSASRDVNPDLDIERKTPSFDVEKLTTILDGGAENTRVRRAVEAVIHSDPVFSREDKYFLSQNESYEAAVKKAVHLKKMMHQMKWSWAGSECKYCNRALGGEVAFTLHNIFMESILALSTDEQTAKWIPLAENYRILGSYAQTELGHGTYIRGFETTATFNISTQEFVLNTPKISAMKWWPGDLGRSATHTVVFAQLYIKGKCYGVHPFIVQIRSLHDHSPAPGVTVGDIGPKMDFNHIDNGYLLLQDVRVPRENMLSRFCELHAFSSGLKAIVTEHSTAGVETCRKACGGHGYSLLSGLPSLYTRLAASCTYEGENTVLLLQTARFLVKCLGAARSGQPVPPSVAYLSAVNSERCLVRDKRDLLQPDVYVEAYRHVAIRVLSSAAAKLQALVQSGAEQHEAWHQCTVQLVHAAKAHCHYHVVKSFAEAVEKLGQEAGIQRIMKHLCGLFALHGIFSNTGDFLHDGYISGDQVDMMTASYLDLLAIVRKDAVPLVDAFDFTDETLNSALGSYDGHVYRRLYQWARKSPSNTKQANQVYENYLKPLFQNGLSKL